MAKKMKGNKSYYFTLIPSGIPPTGPQSYIFGEGTLDDGIKLIEDMEEQFAKWFNAPVYDGTKLFDLPPIPSILLETYRYVDDVPISEWEGADLYATLASTEEEYYYTMDNKWERWGE
jgi:hypothetical protein